MGDVDGYLGITLDCTYSVRGGEQGGVEPGPMVMAEELFIGNDRKVRYMHASFVCACVSVGSCVYMHPGVSLVSFFFSGLSVCMYVSLAWHD